MKKLQNNSSNEDMLDDYDFTGGTQGKYAQRYAEGTNIVALAPDVAESFPDSESVNKALRALIEIARESTNRRR